MQDKEISIGYGRQRKGLKITFPGGIVHVTTGLTNARGRGLVHVSVSADGDRYSGDPEWWAKWGKLDETGAGCRIIQDTRMNVRREA
jgi:hypothetical protein